MPKVNKNSNLLNQYIPLTVAFFSCVLFLIVIIFNVKLINFLFLSKNPVQIVFRLGNLLLGLYLYLKTSVDFAVFMAAMITANKGWKNRIGVEWGTSLGNFAGTLLVIWIWSIFKSIGPAFEGIIIIIASFVLLELAAGSLDRVKEKETVHKVFSAILKIRKLTKPFLFWMPDVEGTMLGKKASSWKALLFYSFTVPFILGSDDFASYISVLNSVNIVSFAAGVIAGHAILLAGLFAFPKKVETLMDNIYFSILSLITFVLLFGFGLFEGIRLLTGS